MFSKLINQIQYMAKNFWKQAFVAMGVLLSLSGFATRFFPDFATLINGWVPFIMALAACVVIGLIRTWKPSKVSFKIHNTDTDIEIIFSDLYEQAGWRAIAVNEFFDSEIGTVVSAKTMHGIFIQKCLEGNTVSFDTIINAELSNITPVYEPAKKQGKNQRYPIGTTVALTVNNDHYLIFALSRTYPTTCKAFCDVATMWIALEGLWNKARIESGGAVINVPLVGSGQSGVGLPAKDLLALVILSTVKASQKNRIAQKIRIVLQNDRFAELDLRKIKQYWGR